MESLASIRVRETARPGFGGGASASATLLQEKREAAAEEAALPPVTFAPSAAKAAPADPFHAAILASHAANMADIRSRGGRPKSAKANKKGKRGAAKGEAYSERLRAKNGGRDKRTERLNAFKKQY